MLRRHCAWTMNEIEGVNAGGSLGAETRACLSEMLQRSGVIRSKGLADDSLHGLWDSGGDAPVGVQSVMRPVSGCGDDQSSWTRTSFALEQEFFCASPQKVLTKDARLVSRAFNKEISAGAPSYVFPAKSRHINLRESTVGRKKEEQFGVRRCVPTREIKTLNLCLVISVLRTPGEGEDWSGQPIDGQGTACLRE